MAAAMIPTTLLLQQSGTAQVFAVTKLRTLSSSPQSLVFQPAFAAATKRGNISSVLASMSPSAKQKDKQTVKKELLEAIVPLDRGVDASPDDQARVDMIAQSLEKLSPVQDTITSPLLNGKWELLYTTSESILKKQRPKLLRPGGPIYQAINNDTLRAQNMESWPFFNQVTANLTPLDGRKVAVKFDVFKIAGLISIKAPGRAQGELEITYLDEEMRVARGDRGNLFILKMVDPTYRVPK